ncbi:MAG: hypothetical protein L3J58_13040 [Emcibacter sp.]|nr:hypothetical protein [Emcibacter sp.]
MSKSKFMQYSGSLEQKRALIAALRLLHEKGVGDKVLAHAIKIACENGKILGFPAETKAEVSRATIQRYREKYDPEKAHMKYSSAGLMYNFLLQSETFATPLLADRVLTC